MSFVFINKILLMRRNDKAEKNMRHLILLLIVQLILYSAYADPSKAHVWKQQNSGCVVKATTGEYPMFTVLKKNKVIYKPKSDGIGEVLFSISGKYIALGSSEVDKVDIGKNKYDIVIVNCESGKKAGYNIGVKELTAAWPAKWNVNDEALTVEYYSIDQSKKSYNLDFSKVKLP